MLLACQTHSAPVSSGGNGEMLAASLYTYITIQAYNGWESEHVL